MPTLYKKISQFLYLTLFPFLSLKCAINDPNKLWQGRLGKIDGQIQAKGPYDLWLQAVSVGEVNVAEAIVRALDVIRPGLNIIISSTTPTGLARAKALFKDRCPVVPYPLDFPKPVEQSVQIISPKIYASIETELWPNMLETVTKHGAKAVLLNGRISANSFKRYRLIKSAIQPILQKFTLLCAISEIYAQRLIGLGAPKNRVTIVGNAKFEGLLKRVDPEKKQKMLQKLKITQNDKVFVAGSLRKGEIKKIVHSIQSVKEDFPNALFILVPRHLKRVSEIAKTLRKKRLKFDLWSKLEVSQKVQNQIVLVDVIGPLFELYSIADVAFVGGSLVPKGGQNLMEPAAWSCPVLFGPYTDNFEECSQALLKTGGGIMVSDGKGLVHHIKTLFANPEQAKQIGFNAKKALMLLAKDAATKQAELLLHLLEQP